MSNLEYRNQFVAAYYTQFAIPEYCSQTLTIYKRLVWSAQYFLSSWNLSVGTISAGTIVRYGKLFHIEFIKGCSLSKIKAAIAAGENPQITLSFRATKSYNLPNLVLVDFCYAGDCNDN